MAVDTAAELVASHWLRSVLRDSSEYTGIPAIASATADSAPDSSCVVCSDSCATMLPE